MQSLAESARNDVVKAEATIRIGYLQLIGGKIDDASATMRAAGEFGRALDARPHSQSAALALAALRLRSSDFTEAYELANRSATERAYADDPWRLFAYGDLAKLPALLDALRATVRR